MQDTKWQPIDLGDGLRAYIEVPDRGGAKNVGLLDAVPVAEITRLIGRIGGAIGTALEQAAPKKAKVELGLSFGLESGQLAALIARGSGEANLKVTLEWERD
jgi:hypothetical protein